MNKEYFFAKLKPLTWVMKQPDFMDLTYIDYHSEIEFLRQRFDFIKFYKENYGNWIMFVKDSNGYIYVEDGDDIVIVGDNWIESKIEVKNGNKI